MAIVVEDGTGLPDANAYASVEDADAYFNLRGRDEWAGLTQGAKEAALVSSADYIDLRWRGRIPGIGVFLDTQGLQFPRKMCNTETAYFPVALKRAAMEYAILASVSPLAPNIELDSTGRLPTRFRDKVGPIEEETYWTKGNTAEEPIAWRPYTVADAFMLQFVTPLPRSGRVIR